MVWEKDIFAQLSVSSVMSKDDAGNVPSVINFSRSLLHVPLCDWFWKVIEIIY